MSFVSEFKDFAMKGNVVDMAVGIIIGAAFGKIVASFVADVLMPPIGVLLGGVNFTDLSFVIQEAVVATDFRNVTNRLFSPGLVCQSVAGPTDAERAPRTIRTVNRRAVPADHLLAGERHVWG